MPGGNKKFSAIFGVPQSVCGWGDTLMEAPTRRQRFGKTSLAPAASAGGLDVHHVANFHPPLRR
jgi:hypothetical protein